jgi:hypothetical protein
METPLFFNLNALITGGEQAWQHTSGPVAPVITLVPMEQDTAILAFSWIAMLFGYLVSHGSK